MKSLTALTAATVIAVLASPIFPQSSTSSPDGAISTSDAITNSVLTASIAAACPTVTETRELCTTWLVPLCLFLSTVTQSCGCPTPIPTVQLDFPCSLSCSGLTGRIWCSTSYDTVTSSDCPGSTNAAARMRVPFSLW
ncbi:uncharacterized protein B0T15DRAFT_189066 [Chaetomium strumarium]|uniref:Uncharacterized protein n=1 Tax=Chaetomium strumarium TaxID=1170767 RepID=A0AAJ0M150_9PEZI|nr:hypothetical protein B0T15DRAFT_189066 [Chaetomium strumarium]